MQVSDNQPYDKTLSSVVKSGKLKFKQSEVPED
jgi:hypothetical protein